MKLAYILHLFFILLTKEQKCFYANISISHILSHILNSLTAIVDVYDLHSGNLFKYNSQKFQQLIVFLFDWIKKTI